MIDPTEPTDTIDRVFDAFAIASRGWLVFPIAPNGKEPHPMLGPAGGHHHATTDREIIKQWWEEDPTANIGISLEPSGLVALDVDKGKGGMDSLAEIDSELAGSLTVLTGSGGLHVFYRRTDVSQARRKIGFLPGLDLLGLGYVVAVGSTHACGGKYRWANDAEIVDLPARLANVFAPAQATTLQGSTSDEPASPTVIAAARNRLIAHGPAIQGQGGDTKTFQVGAILLNDFALSWDQAFPLALEWNTRCVPPWDESELAAKLRNGERSASGVRGEARSAVEFGEILRAPKDDAPPVELPGNPGEWEYELERARRDVASLASPDRIVASASGRLFEDARDLFKRQFPATAWRVEGLLTDSGVAALATEPKSAKTWAATEIAIAVATGTSCFGRFTTHRGKVAYFYAEDMAVAIRNRIRALLKSRGIDPDRLEGLHVQPRGRDLNILHDESLANLLASVRMLGDVALLVLDPLREIHDGEEDKSDAMAPVMKRLRFLAYTLGCAVLFVHHSGKSGPEASKRRGGQRMRGSSVIHGSVDCGLYFGELETDGKTTFTNRVEVEVKAARGAGFFGLTLKLEDDASGAAIDATWTVEGSEERKDRKEVEEYEAWVAAILRQVDAMECRSLADIRRGAGCGGNRVAGFGDRIAKLVADGKLFVDHVIPRQGGRAFDVYRTKRPEVPDVAIDETSVAARWIKRE